jgi:hypothetical protein
MNGTTDTLDAVYRTNLTSGSNAITAVAGLQSWFCAEWVRPA